MKKRTIKIGTRGSKLAIWQAEKVKKAIRAISSELDTRIITVKTKGDILMDISLSKVTDKGFFTNEIEKKLLSGEIDLAVHSLKDMPTELPNGLIIGGMLARGEVRDVFLSNDGRTLSQMTGNDKIATSSLRRKAQLLHFNPKLNVIEIRGNVDTRVQKMQNGYCDGQVLAGAGIIRLGLEKMITEYLDPNIVIPAVSQGAIAMEIREDDEIIGEIINEVSDEYTRQTTLAERCFLRTLEGGCQIPVGCFTERHGNQLKIIGMVSSLDGKITIKKFITCSIEEASEKAIELARSILNDGGNEVLKEIKKLSK